MFRFRYRQALEKGGEVEEDIPIQELKKNNRQFGQISTSTACSPPPVRSGDVQVVQPTLTRTPATFSRRRLGAKEGESPYPVHPSEDDIVEFQTPALISRTKREKPFSLRSVTRKLSFSSPLVKGEDDEEEEEGGSSDEEEEEEEDDDETVDLCVDVDNDHFDDGGLGGFRWKGKVESLQRAIAEMKEREMKERKILAGVYEKKLAELVKRNSEKMSSLEQLLECKNKLVSEQKAELRRWTSGKSPVLQLYENQMKRSREERQNLLDRVHQRNTKVDVLNCVIESLKRNLELAEQAKGEALARMEELAGALRASKKHLADVELRAEAEEHTSFCEELEMNEQVARHWRESFELSREKNELLKQRVEELQEKLAGKEMKVIRLKKKTLEKSRYIDAKNKVTEFLTREIEEVRMLFKENKQLLTVKETQLGRAKELYEELRMKYTTLLNRK